MYNNFKINYNNNKSDADDRGRFLRELNIQSSNIILFQFHERIQVKYF